MEAFFSTLLGAFLGVSCPFVIAHILERGRFKKTVNFLFIKTELFYEMLLAVDREFISRMNNKKEEERRSLLVTNLGDHFEATQFIPVNQWKFIKLERQFGVMSSDHNVRVAMSSLLTGSFKVDTEIKAALNTLILAAAMSMWEILLLTEKKELNVKFDRPKFLEMIDALNAMDNKDIYKLKFK